MTDLRNAANVLIGKFGRSITLYNVSSSTVDDYGQETVTWDGGTSMLALVDQPTEEEVNVERHGEIIGNMIYFYLPHTNYSGATTINTGDRITYNSINWNVDSVDQYHFFNKYSVIRVLAHRTSD